MKQIQVCAKTAIVCLWAASGWMALHVDVNAAEFTRADKTASLVADTRLMEIKYDADHVQWLSSARAGGFETSTGNPVSFRPWYQNNGWRNATAAWMTPLSPSMGVIWGLGTGERAAKYSISSSVKLGFVYYSEIYKNNFISFRASTVLGGRLKEKPCMADYGEVGGGDQAVNCRLAGTALAPSQTLQFLFNEKPYNHTQFNISYSMVF